MKKFLALFSILVLILFSIQSFVCAQNISPQTSQIPTYATYQNCLRIYQLPAEKLYMLALASVTYNKFEILEMQSRNGYILFEADNKEFLLSVMNKDKKSSLIKITPADNNYAFSVAIPQKIFIYIDANFNLPIQEVK